MVLGLEPISTFSLMTNDGSRFLRLCSAFTLPLSRSWSPVNVAAEPVNVSLRRRNMPFPTTSTPFSCATSSLRTICRFFCLSTFTSLVTIPMKEMTMTAPLGTVSWKLPTSLVMQFTCTLPFITTVAPGSGSPFLSQTFPLTVIFEPEYWEVGLPSTATVSLTCAPTCKANKRKKVTRPKTFLTIVIDTRLTSLKKRHKKKNEKENRGFTPDSPHIVLFQHLLHRIAFLHDIHLSTDGVVDALAGDVVHLDGSVLVGTLDIDDTVFTVGEVIDVEFDDIGGL